MQSRQEFLKTLLALSVFGPLSSARRRSGVGERRADRGGKEPKIDAWTHVLPREYLDRLTVLPSGPLTPLINFLSKIEPLFNMAARFRVMDEFENYRQVVTPVPGLHVSLALANPQLAGALVQISNDAMAELVTNYPDRFVGFAAMLPMWDPDATVREVERAITSLGAIGVQIEANVNGIALDDPRYLSFFGRMAELGRPIWIHPARTPASAEYPTEQRSRYGLWQVLGWPYETAVCLARLVFAGHLERYPTLRIVAHHGGGMIPHFSGRLGPTLDYLGRALEPELGAALQSLSKPAIDYFRMMYVDTALFGATHAVQCVIEFFGADHVLFGTDMPFDPEQGPGFIRDTIGDLESMHLREPARKQIYAGNILRVLGSSNQNESAAPEL